MALRLVVTSLILVAGAARMGAAGMPAEDTTAPQRAKARAEKQREAEAVEKAAFASKDPAKYAECGTAYLAVYDSDSANPLNDETLYNAGVCFTEARSIGSALQAFALLRRFYPRSPLAMKALARSAMMYADTALYERAAEQLEEYAIKYAGEADAYVALGEAVHYYRALGNPKWIQLTQAFIKTYGGKRPAEAAQAYFALSAAYDGDADAQIKHLRSYIRLYAKGADDRLLLAYAKLGDLHWAKACPVKTPNGLCMKVSRVKAGAGKRCREGVVVDEVGVVRDEKLVKEALQAYQAALKVHGQLGGKTSPDATYAAAMAKLAVADRELEQMMSMPLSKGLELDRKVGANDEARRMRSLRRLEEWVEVQQKAGAALRDRYQEVLALREPSAGLAATQRIAQMNQWMWEQLDAAELPKGQGEGYCKTLRDVAEPLGMRAREAYLVCSAKAAELRLYTPHVEACLRALEKLDPELFPAQKERVAPALSAGTVLAVEPPITRAPW